MLDHTVLKEAQRLEGLYQRAFDRICNQVPTVQNAYQKGKVTK